NCTLLVLNSFDDYAEVEVLCHGHDRANQFTRLGRHASQIGGERTVDLDRIERQLGETAQAGVAGGKIVQLQPDAEFLQRLHDAARFPDVMEDGAFGNFNLQRARFDADLRQDILYLAGKLRIAQLHG